jgi:hypothetical protein
MRSIFLSFFSLKNKTKLRGRSPHANYTGRETAAACRRSFFFYYLVCEAIGTATTPGLLYQPRVIMKTIVEKQMERRLAGETEVLGGNLPQRHFCPSQNST